MKPRLIFTFLFLYLLIVPALAQHEPPEASDHCQALLIHKIVASIDSTQYEIFQKKEPALYVTLVNTCKGCKMEGPDYVLLWVLSKQNDTIAKSAINGIPKKLNDKRTYKTFVTESYNADIDVKELRVALQYYCNDITYNKPRPKGKDQNNFLLLDVFVDVSLQLTFIALEILVEALR